MRNTAAADAAHLVAAFLQGLRETGYVDKQNIAIEFRWSDGRDDQLPALVGDLVRHPVAVLVAANISSLVAAKAATTSIPIVFVTGDDPVQLGLVDSLNRPAGNVTGISFIIPSGMDEAQFPVLFRETWSVTLSLMKIGEI